jgi:transposase-like protein
MSDNFSLYGREWNVNRFAIGVKCLECGKIWWVQVENYNFDEIPLEKFVCTTCLKKYTDKLTQNIHKENNPPSKWNYVKEEEWDGDGK